MVVDRKAFFATLRKAWGPFKRPQVAGLDALLDFLEADRDVSDRRWAACMLGNVKWEGADTWKPIVERGGASYFRQYDPGTAKGARLGNTEPGDGARFKGRGYSMITGRDNYRRLGVRVGVPLEAEPERALEPPVAYAILSVGMREGLFTGKKLSNYFNDTRCDYVNSRRIINGLDRAELIASYAQVLASALGND